MRPVPVLVAALLLGTLVVGCVTPGTALDPAQAAAPSVVRFDGNLTVLERLSLARPDGVKLDLVANLSVEGLEAGERMPVIVDIGPYFGTTIMQYSAIDKRLADYFIPRGYVVARASLRGTGHSEGCFDIGGETEQQDVKAIVEFLAGQPWSNGKVAVFGKSYDGTTPWMAAITKAEGLATIVPVSGITDMYRYMFYDGTVYPEEVAFQPYYYLSVGEDISIPGPDGDDPNWDGDRETLLKSIHPCQAHAFPEQTRSNMQSTVTGDHDDPFWHERDYEARILEMETPVFLVHGLQDWNVKPDHEIPLWNDIRAPKAMWLGQWAHDYPDINRYHADWSRHDWNETLLVWLDHWTKGVEGNGWESLLVAQVQDQLGTWRTYDAWPPADALDVVLHPTPAGGLADAPEAGDVRVVNTGMGWSPARSMSGAAFVTDPVAAPVTLIGRPSVDLHVTTDRAGGNVAAQLFIVAKDGSWKEWDHGSRDLRHRETREKGTPVTPLAKVNTTLWLYPAELTLQEGERLGLVLAPEIPRWIVPSPLGAGATQTYHLGEGLTTLRLQVRADTPFAWETTAAPAARLAPVLEMVK